jgi:ABC-type Mn2+/Zn2+ transport system ATPase subunit
MKFWNWFEANGDKVFNFVTLASVMLAKVDGLSAGTSQAILIAGVLATAAHQSFFPSTRVNP